LDRDYIAKQYLSENHLYGVGLMGDTQSIAIGVQNNNLVGPDRAGPRNQRRTPGAVNVAFYPKLMWNGRFESLSGDPFNNSAGFKFPPPEGTTKFPANDPIVTHLLIAQAHIPPTELAVPQIAPGFGVGVGNVIFDGPGQNEDFGLEQVTGNSVDRYKFRTSPLRNVALQPAFFHNGAFTRLEDAINHHLDVANSARHYNAVTAGVDADLTHRLGPIEPVLARLDPLVATPIRLTNAEFTNLVSFVRDGLLDSRASAANLCPLRPASVPSGFSTLTFQGCP
jgi:hypothetical protein